MRQLLNLRLWAALGLLVLSMAIVVATTCSDCFGKSTGAVSISKDVEKNIESVAVVTDFSAGDGWRTENGRTVSELTVTLDDGRVIVIASDTPGENQCSDFDARSSCVFLANMFGESVMWFALTNTNGDRPTRVLEMPSLVDMLDAGSRGVLANGWIVKLANGVKKTCGEDSGTLREFINNYSPDKSLTKLNLITDQVDEVVCTG